jgi:hypothetical protein
LLCKLPITCTCRSFMFFWVSVNKGMLNSISRSIASKQVHHLSISPPYCHLYPDVLLVKTSAIIYIQMHSCHTDHSTLINNKQSRLWFTSVSYLINFFLSEITGFRWLELQKPRKTYFDIPFEFEPPTFFCILKPYVLSRKW